VKRGTGAAPAPGYPCALRFCVLFLTVFSGCSAERPGQTTGPRPLPADSAAMLTAALQRARPAYDTQAEALRAGVYRPVVPFAAAHPGSSPDPSPTPTTGAPAARRPEDATVRQRPSEPRPDAGVRPAAARAEYVVQIAAFQDLSSAERAASTARRDLPGLVVRIDQDAGLFRVSIGRWLDAAAAGLRLHEIREFYPSAWVRVRSVP
jgi:cell division septation protein DedD